MRIEKTQFESDLGFLKSEHIVAFTQTGTTAMGEAEGDQTYIKAGTIFPANDETAIGIVLDTVDVTAGSEPISVMVEGHVVLDRLPVEPTAEAQAAMKFIGFW